jgi:hypothetical protein
VFATPNDLAFSRHLEETRLIDRDDASIASRCQNRPIQVVSWNALFGRAAAAFFILAVVARSKGDACLLEPWSLRSYRTVARDTALHGHLNVEVQPGERPKLIFTHERSFLSLAVYRGDEPRRVEGDTPLGRRLGTQALLGEE